MSIEKTIQDKRCERLKELVSEFGGQAELAYALDVTPGYISSMVTGGRPITEKTVNKIEDKLNRIDYFSLGEFGVTVQEGKAKILLDISSCSPKARQLMFDIVHIEDMSQLPPETSYAIKMILKLTVKALTANKK